MDAASPYDDDDPYEEADRNDASPCDEALLDQRKRHFRNHQGKSKRFLERKPRSLKTFAKKGIGSYEPGEDLPTIDARTRLGQRYLQVAADVIKDAGGIERVAAVKLVLVRRFAACAALAEQIEERAMNDEPFNAAEHLIYTSALVKLAKVLGTGHVPVEVPSLEDYLSALQKGGGANGAAAVEEGALDLAGGTATQETGADEASGRRWPPAA
jgi:hypothetical protein